MTLHPQSKRYLDARAASGARGWHQMPIDEARRGYLDACAAYGAGPELTIVEDFRTDRNIRCRRYSNGTTEREPVLFFFHGGGFVLGDVESHDALCRRLTIATECSVVSVDYRRAPEHRCPIAVEDCEHAVRFVLRHADRLGLASDRIVLAGDSAGGNLATITALRLRDDFGSALRSQVLIYPVIEPTDDTPSYRRYAEGFGLSREVMNFFWSQYLGEQSPTRDAVPTLHDTLAGLPPAHIVLAECDVLFSEGEAYANALRAANVPVTCTTYAGMLHGFVHAGDLFDDAQRAVDEIGEVVRTHLAMPRHNAGGDGESSPPA